MLAVDTEVLQVDYLILLVDAADAVGEVGDRVGPVDVVIGYAVGVGEDEAVQLAQVYLRPDRDDVGVTLEEDLHQRLELEVVGVVVPVRLHRESLRYGALLFHPDVRRRPLEVLQWEGCERAAYHVDTTVHGRDLHRGICGAYRQEAGLPEPWRVGLGLGGGRAGRRGLHCGILPAE